ncbi:hypothetical protein Dacet_0326 [Denitrovibrio acetiphilus DSM 12809]|uniref:FG-GAP repeat protein n=1 Tax=Denitrovibrio acetiphilus (strain DSM 12809 / NBRC 114555 / N2460) TaxID=522772 RepID=D4H2R5_DENA2|nr:hypothetical protein [Denitrovibrio acetiphilus]ADD67126.1 hypothetical protein Dacet_0326 [Denitrovibrio acetiphilus DSM 12809]
MKKILFLMLVLIPAVAFARFEKLTADIDDMFSRFTGYVVSVEDNDIITDLGLDKGVFPGMELKIFRKSEPIIHPVTKQVLGNKKIYVGDLVIKSVYGKYSEAKSDQLNRAVKPGDIIAMNPPVEVAVETENIPVRLKLLLKEELGRVSNILIKDSAPLVLTFSQKEEGGIGYTVTEKKSGTLVYSRYFSDQDLGQGGGSMATKDILYSDAIDETYKSMAVGHAKNDKNIYIAAATKKRIDLYEFTGTGFIPAGSVDKEFDNIQNIELADLDGDSVDELFVTEVRHESTVRSSIYEYDRGSFKELESDMQYIFRTVFVKGNKEIVAQKLAVDGSSIGMVHKFLYVKDRYERGGAVSKSPSIGIYGFGYSDINGDGTSEVFHIDDNYRLNVYNDSNVEYTSVQQFGQTPYYFILANEVKNETNSSIMESKNDGDNDPFVYEKLKKYIKGRVFVNSDNNVYVVQNEQKYKMLASTKIFESSMFAVYSWDGRRLRSMWQSEVMEPTIVDYYMYEEYGRTYLFMLRNFSDGLLKGDKSQLIYIETK